MIYSASEFAAKSKFLRKCLGRPFLITNRWFWRRLPKSMLRTRLLLSYGRFLQHLVRLQQTREQNVATFFFRNRPELELISNLAGARSDGKALRVLVLGCSKGAEAYSILFTLHKDHPNMDVDICGVDISETDLGIAKQGVYERDVKLVGNASIHSRLTDGEIAEIFDENGRQLKIKPWMQKAVRWVRGDATDSTLCQLVGRFDIVLANRFLCHMTPQVADQSLRNISRMVVDGGHLLVSGIDLDIRTKVAMELGWSPVTQHLEAVHDGDPSLRAGWPWVYSSLEPLDKSLPDWQIRFCSVFHLPGTSREHDAP